jgi:hypothetical protein
VERYLVIRDGEAWILAHLSCWYIFDQTCWTQAQISFHYQSLWVPTLGWTKWPYTRRAKHNHSGIFLRCECTWLCCSCIQPVPLLVCVWHVKAAPCISAWSIPDGNSKAHCYFVTLLKSNSEVDNRDLDCVYCLGKEVTTLYTYPPDFSQNNKAFCSFCVCHSVSYVPRCIHFPDCKLV